MRLAHIAIENLRNLQAVSVDLSSTINLLYGANGSGKTSFLEAINYLILGRSFRTRINTHIINQACDHFSIFAQAYQNTQQIALGIQRSRNGEAKIRLDGKTKDSLLEITRLLPVRLLNPDSRLMLTAGSKGRRQFLDWGVFHVEPQFLASWQYARRVLKQRNAALKLTRKASLVQIWDMELINSSKIVNQLRLNYLEQFTPIFQAIFSQLLSLDEEISLNYYPGWNEELGLEASLQRSLERDLQLTYTQYGAHKADFNIRIGKRGLAQDFLSQGQQKLLLYAMYLAQGVLLNDKYSKPCLYLLDDLAAELDNAKRQCVLETLININAQIFITTTDKLQFSIDSTLVKLFHVKHGQVFA